MSNAPSAKDSVGGYMVVSIARSARAVLAVTTITTLVSFGCSSAEAGSDGRSPVVRIEILEVQSPTYEGTTFGDVGAYEFINARAHLAIDPADRRNALIADIDLAPRNADGMVE